MGLHFCLLVVLCFALGLQNSYCTEQWELQYVQILFRHGDRTPIHLYPTDPNPKSVWTEGLGKLTLLGRKQHYTFGKVLRERYKDFISSSPMEIDIKSSDCDRCIKSAESNAASFYAPKEKWKFESDVNWQPLTVNYIPRQADMYLETESECPKASEEQRKIVLSKEGQKFIAEHSEMFKNVTHYSGLQVTNWTSASYLFDTLFIEKKYNLTIPDWADHYWNEMRNVSNLSFYWSFKSPTVLRLRAGPLLGLIVQNMRNKISGMLGAAKVQIFSAHDTNVAVVMLALNIFNMKQPPYCAALAFELYKAEKRYTVRILYFNSTSPEEGMQTPHVLKLDGCSEYCPFEFFDNCTRDLVPSDWQKECNEMSTYFSLPKTGMMTMLLVSTVSILVLLVAYCVFSKIHGKQKSDEEYTYHLMLSEDMK